MKKENKRPQTLILKHLRLDAGVTFFIDTGAYFKYNEFKEPEFKGVTEEWRNR